MIEWQDAVKATKWMVVAEACCEVVILARMEMEVYAGWARTLLKRMKEEMEIVVVVSSDLSSQYTE